MYATTIEKQTVTLAVSGMLWENSLVMIDQETESLWSQLLGEAMQGPLQGEQLEVIPSTITDWKSWREKYPQTTVVQMPRTSRSYRRRFHQRSKRLLIGLSEDDVAKGWMFSQLATVGCLNGQLGDRDVLVAFDKTNGASVLFDRTLEGRTLDFTVKKGAFVDGKTSSQWDLLTGVCRSGTMKGKRLRQLPGIVSTRDAWSLFHPKTTIVEGN